MRFFLSITAWLFLANVPVSAQQEQVTSDGYKIYHSFGALPDDGTQPRSSLNAIGDYLYGRTTKEGLFNGGVIFRMKKDGTAYDIIHHFKGADGKNPRHHALTALGTKLYGTTQTGGAHRKGVVYVINTQGSLQDIQKSYNVIHEFNGTEGAFPHTAYAYQETKDGIVLYGTTAAGGQYNKGVLYAMKADGSDFRLLHQFSGKDGNDPHGEPVLSGHRLYGMTRKGGAIKKTSKQGNGVIYGIDTDGKNFEVIHMLHRKEGSHTMHCTPIVDDGILYGMTTRGGKYDQGVIFALTLESKDYKILHDFYGKKDGKHPYGSLVKQGPWLYGMTAIGGKHQKGIVFALKTDGSAFQVLHDFLGEPEDGRHPNDDVTYVEGTLYGLTTYGGAKDQGAIFSLKIPASAGGK